LRFTTSIGKLIYFLGVLSARPIPTSQPGLCALLFRFASSMATLAPACVSDVRWHGARDHRPPISTAGAHPTEKPALAISKSGRPSSSSPHGNTCRSTYGPERWKRHQRPADVTKLNGARLRLHNSHLLPPLSTPETPCHNGTSHRLSPVRPLIPATSNTAPIRL
jgi:hypothetical protein